MQNVRPLSNIRNKRNNLLLKKSVAGFIKQNKNLIPKIDFFSKKKSKKKFLSFRRF